MFLLRNSNCDLLSMFINALAFKILGLRIVEFFREYELVFYGDFPRSAADDSK